MAEGVGRELKPVKFGVESAASLNPQPVTKPDQFGQVYDAQKDHVSGNVPSAAQVDNQHRNSDVDSSPQSQHHTLGSRRNQAAPGDHIHDGVSSSKLGPLEMDPANPGKTRPVWTCAATATDIRALLHNFIEFRDV